MIPIDTWAVIAVGDGNVTLECPFMPESGTWTVPIEEIGIEECNPGDIFSTETGGWLHLNEDELKDLTDNGRIIFEEYLERKGFTYYDTKRFGYISCR